MTAWVTIPDGDIDPDSPITTPLMTALRDNVAATAEGSSGAPAVTPNSCTTHVAAAGAIVVASNADQSVSTTSTTYVKLIELIIPYGGEFRIDFDLDGNAIANGYARIYRNGTAVGTERSTANPASFSEDISGWSSGDLLQLYLKHDSDTATVTSFLVKADTVGFGFALSLG